MIVHITKFFQKSTFFLLSLLSLLGIQLDLSAKQQKILVFDFGGVIADTDLTELTDFVSRTFNISNQETKVLLKQWHKLDAKKRIGIGFWLNYAASQGKILPKTWSEDFIRRSLQAIHPLPGMISLIEELKQSGYQTALLSNTTPFQAEMIGKLGYYHLFQPVLLSYQIGHSKPNKTAYEILLKTLNKPARDCLFIDDKEENVEGARSLGIDSILFISADQLREELIERGIELESFSALMPYNYSGQLLTK